MVVLHRQHRGALEVYWVRRSDRLAFLPGFWAFPGGRVDDTDRARPTSGPGGELEARIAAASRELREETGVDVAPDPARFCTLGVTVTPAWAPIRFDATYFLVEAPADQAPDPVAASTELEAGEWVTVSDALAAWASGARLTSPVVVFVLEALLPGLAGASERFAAAAAAAPADEDGRIWELVPGIAVSHLRTPTLPPATHTNCYVVGSDELVVIDPASPWPDEQSALDAALDRLAGAGRRVREIWLTHHHVDHVGGAAHLAARLGVPVAAHPATAALVADRIPVTRLLADGEVQVLPGRGAVPERRLRAVFTPGHAPGHLAFFEETTAYCIVGDMVAQIGTIVIDPDEGDMAEYLASLARLRALDAKVLLPAHGAPISAARAKLDEYTAHRLAREAQVFAALAALGAGGRASARDLVPTVYRDVPVALHPLAQRSLLAHLIKLEREHRIERREPSLAGPAGPRPDEGTVWGLRAV